nr:MAG: iron-sulfur cluster assembly scaffold protein [Hyphomicrobiales bacterium]
MDDPLYSKPLLRLAALAAGAGRLEPCDAQGSAHNPVCGDKISVTLHLEDGRLVQMAHQTQACVLTQASASILGAHLTGNRQDVEALHRQVGAMLRGGDVPPAPFAEYAALIGAASHRNRHKCVLLPLDAVLDALSNG